MSLRKPGRERGSAWRRGLPVAALVAGVLGGGAAAASELDCLIEPKVRARVSTPVPGVLEEISVERGDLVEEGQVLAQLESSVEQAAVAIAKARAEMVAEVRSSQARLELGQWEHERTKALHDRSIASIQETQIAETNKRVAELELLGSKEAQELLRLELRRARANLQRRTIRSPVRGVVVDVLSSPGEFFDEEPIVELAQLDPLRVEVFAPISMLGNVAVGSTGVVRPEAPVGGEYEAEVTVVDRVVDAASGTFGIRLEIPNPDYALSAGLNCRISFAEPGATSEPVAAAGDPPAVEDPLHP